MVFSMLRKSTGAKVRERPGPEPASSSSNPVEVPSSIKGWVGINKRRQVVGWLADTEKPEEKLSVVAMFGDWSSKPQPACEPRDHLRSRGLGDGCYGFTFEIPSEVNIEAGGQVSVHPVNAPDKRISNTVHGTDWDFDQAIAGGGKLREQLSGESKWTRMASVGRAIAGSGTFEKLLRDAGRANTNRQKYEVAQRLLTACNALYPGSHETALHLGTALSRGGRQEAALDVLRPLFAAEPCTRNGSELAQALVRAIDRNSHGGNPALQAELCDVVEHVLTLEEKDHVLPPSVGNNLVQAGYRQLGLRVIEHYIAQRPNNPNGFVAKSRFLLAQSQVDEALELSKEILERWPDNQAAAFDLRIFDKLRSTRPLDENVRLAWLREGSDALELQSLEAEETATPAAHASLAALAQAACDWFVLGSDAPSPRLEEWREMARRAPSVGCIRVSDEVVLWRREAVACLIESDLLTEPASGGTSLAAQLAVFEPAFCALSKTPSRPPGGALVISRYGATKFGGAEHTLATLAAHYSEYGYTPILVGTHSTIVGEKGTKNGFAFENLPEDPALLRRHILTSETTLVHTISGLGYTLAQALNYTNIPFVYGVHFWREVLGHQTGETYFDELHAPIPRPEFSFILSRAASVYVNSKYTQEIIEMAHGVRCPIISSVPEDRAFQ